MTKDNNSLEEVWEMKDRAWNDFLKSGLESYVEYLHLTVKEAKIKYNIKNYDGASKNAVETNF